jgi:hypothetical protein
MFNTIKAKNEAIEILRNYDGMNPYILSMKRDVILLQKTSLLTDYVVEYIITNKDKLPQAVNKIIKIADWFGEKLKNNYNIEFTPEKLQIINLLGETTNAYHCTIKYRKNMNPLDTFLPKKGLLGNFLVEDYRNYVVDFDRYDKLSTLKDSVVDSCISNNIPLEVWTVNTEDEIIKMHSGEINISSQTGVGTTVEIILPIIIKEN